MRPDDARRRKAPIWVGWVEGRNPITVDLASTQPTRELNRFMTAGDLLAAIAPKIFDPGYPKEQVHWDGGSGLPAQSF